MRILLSALAMLIMSLPSSLAFDEFVHAELEAITMNDSISPTAELQKRRTRLYDAISETCKKHDEANRTRCKTALLLLALDHTRTLFRGCEQLQDRRAVDECIVIGPVALTIVAALGGDPSKDIDWEHVRDSYVRLDKSLQETTRIRCGSGPEPLPSECMIGKQAELLGLPEFIGTRCTTGQRYTWQSCLDLYRALAIYLQAASNL